jgi:hypothetical protein
VGKSARWDEEVDVRYAGDHIVGRGGLSLGYRVVSA